MKKLEMLNIKFQRMLGISSINFWINMQGKCYEINQETGEPVFQGKYQIRMSTTIQDIFDMEEIG